MKTLFDSRVQRFLAMASIFLVMVALTAGMVGCGDGVKYTLTMAVAGGNGTATDLTDASPYAAGTEVSIQAAATAGYHFVNWTAPAGGFADATASQTTFTMPAQDVAVIANFASGTPVWDWHDLDAVRENLDGNYTLMNNLDSTTAGYEEVASPSANGGKGWRPIGTFNVGTFAGTFEGQGYEIRDLFINRPNDDDVGVFACIRGTVRNVGVVNAAVTGWNAVGCLVGSSLWGTVNNCWATGSVTSNFGSVGGLLGYNSEGAVIDCYATCNITGAEWWVGGLTGGSWGDLFSNSYYNYDKVFINGENRITFGALCDGDFEQWLASGKFLDVNERLSNEDDYYLINDVNDLKQLLGFGHNGSLRFRLTNDLDLVGDPNFYIPYLAGEFDGNDHKISNLAFNCDFVFQVGLFGYLASSAKVSELGIESVNITAGAYAGGLAGVNCGTVDNCYSTGDVSGKIYAIGGLVGYNRFDGTVSDSHSACSANACGIVGGLAGTIQDGCMSNCYATGDVTASYEVGGLAGNLYCGTVSSCYATGSVTGDADDAGGLIGLNDYGTVTNSFWDIETSGQSTSDGGIGKNTTEMQDISTFSGASWNITTVANPTLRNPSYIWNIVNNVTYPFLSWEAVS